MLRRCNNIEHDRLLVLVVRVRHRWYYHCQSGSDCSDRFSAPAANGGLPPYLGEIQISERIVRAYDHVLRDL